MARKTPETAGSRLKAQILELYTLDPRETAFLERACGIADQLELIEAQLLREPLSVDGTAHPLLKVQSDLANRFQRLLEGIDLPHKTERLSARSKAAQRAANIRWAREKGGQSGRVA